MRKSTKVKLIAPLLCIVAGFSVSIGGTYALFTSSDNVDIAVTSGQVDLTAEVSSSSLSVYTPKSINMDDYTIVDDTNIASGTTFGNGGTASISGGVLSLTNVAPGDSASFDIKFTNNSNINIKYRVSYEDVTTYEDPSDEKLVDYLVVKADETEISSGTIVKNWTNVAAGASIADLHIEVELPTNTPDTYQLLSSSLKFTVEAVQQNAFTAKTVTIVNNATDASVDNESFTVPAGETFRIEATDTSYVNIFTVNSTEVARVTWNDNIYAYYLVNETKYYVSDLSEESSYFEFVVSDDMTVTLQNGGCVAKGTLITLSDNTTKKVEDLRKGDKLITYSMIEGGFIESDIIYVFHNYQTYPTFSLSFDTGDELKIVCDEDLFDVEQKEYFTVDSTTCDDIVGRRVLAYINGERNSATITNVVKGYETIDCYTVYTYVCMNYIANNIVSHVAGTSFIYNNLFTITDDLKADPEILAADIANYGYFEYDQVSDIISEELFDAMGYKYLNIIIGKGLLTVDDAIELIQLFANEAADRMPIFEAL